MYKNIKVEAENGELILFNGSDHVIIPANKRDWVKDKLSSGCHDCIDKLVATLPTMRDYAEDGTVITGEGDPEEPIGTKQKRFFRDYLKSPKYRERLVKQGYEDPDATIAARGDNMEKTVVKEDNKWDGSNYQANWSAQVNMGSLSLLENEPKGSNLVVHAPEKDIANVKVNQDKGLYTPGSVDGELVIAHEVAHATGASDADPDDENLQLNEKEQAEIAARSTSTDEHDKKVDEVKADMDAFRFKLKEDGLYDTGTQEFTEDLYNTAIEKYKDDPILMRFFNNSSKEDTIWMMNNIAKNEEAPADTTVA